MSDIQVLLVAGTHGNEINAAWIFDQFEENEKLIDFPGLDIQTVIGNPIARKNGCRYLDRDLNRSFSNDLLNNSGLNNLEIDRAQWLLSKYGPAGTKPSKIVIDFHSTTAAMGSSLVIYGRRSADLALASIIQNRLGLPIYLHEGDPSQKGFLVESWPCGLVVEIGPVPQSLLSSQIIKSTLLILLTSLKEIIKANSDQAIFPNKVVIHRHLKSLDFPRDRLGRIASFIHPKLQGRDWYPIKGGHPLFVDLLGKITYLDLESFSGEVIPLFINEAAYAEKGIAMSLTKREVLDLRKEDFKQLIELFNI
ncbi:aspartoacylase [Prochlorococcus marinus]|uniref:aspartoacylase n=1 Tax=Prochlorococcus marinus TaxID=1219 RepID=UPI0022B4561E|nr:aspartoacylase [Prochlorococcus marinus]